MTVTEGDRGQRPGQAPATGGPNGAHNGAPAELREDEMATARTARMPRAAAPSGQPPAKPPVAQPSNQPSNRGPARRRSRADTSLRISRRPGRISRRPAAESAAESTAASVAESARRPTLRTSAGIVRLSDWAAEPTSIGSQPLRPAPHDAALAVCTRALAGTAELGARGPGQAEDVAAGAARPGEAGPNGAGRGDRAHPADHRASDPADHSADHSAAGRAGCSRTGCFRAGCFRSGGSSECPGPCEHGAAEVDRPSPRRHQRQGCATGLRPSGSGSTHRAARRGSPGCPTARGSSRRRPGSRSGSDEHSQDLAVPCARTGCRRPRVASCAH